MKFPPRWIDGMTLGQRRAAWHGVYCERVRDYIERAAVMRLTGDVHGVSQLMGYARHDALNARREYQWMLDVNKGTA